MALKQEEVLYRNGYDIGLGVSMATGSPMALGARGDVTPPQIGTGGAGSFTFRRIDTTEDLEKELDIGAEASGGIGLFSASASFGFSERCKIHSSSLTVLVSAKEELAFQQMDSPELTPAAAMLVENGKPIADQFGDYFIRGIKTGGRFFGIVRIETRSEQAKTELDAELSGSYGLAISVDAKLRISEAMSRSSGRAAAFINYEGGRVMTRPTSDNPVQALEQLFKAMDEWTTSVRNDPKAYSVTLAPYIIALGPTPPNIAEIENQRDVLIRCAKLRSQNIDKLNLIDYILDPKHMNEFEIIPPPQGPDLPALQAALARDRDVIADAASFAINNIKEVCDPETYMKKVKGVADFKFTALPTNLPKHGKALAPLMPNFVGMSVPQALEIKERLGIKSIEPALSGTDLYRRTWSTLSKGSESGERSWLYDFQSRPHTDDELQITEQVSPDPGTVIVSGVTVVYVKVDLMPGVSLL